MSQNDPLPCDQCDGLIGGSHRAGCPRRSEAPPTADALIDAIDGASNDIECDTNGEFIVRRQVLDAAAKVLRARLPEVLPEPDAPPRSADAPKRKPDIEEYEREDRIINRILNRPHEPLTYEQVQELRAFVRGELRRESDPTPDAVNHFACVDPKSREGRLRSVLWDILGGLGAESVESAAQRVVRERDVARLERDVNSSEAYRAWQHVARLNDQVRDLGAEPVSVPSSSPEPGGGKSQ